MTKFITVVGICLLVWSCKTPTISVMKDPPSTDKMTMVKIDSTYSLFIRSVCKNDKYEPVDCSDTPTNMVEIEYMFLSLAHKKVLIVNNIPNRNQRFYDGSNLNKLFSPDAEINSLLFKQFRFGRVEVAENGVLLHFKTTEKKSRTYIWVCKAVNTQTDSLAKPGYTIESIQTQLADGYDLRRTDKALKLVPKFLKSDNYKIVYQVTSANMDGATSPKAELPGNIFWIQRVNRTCIRTYLIFDENIDNSKNKAILFGANRMYAFDSFNE